MKILHAILSHGFYGSERYCIELATAQARAGHQVDVLGGFQPHIVHSHLNPAARRVGRVAQRLGILHVATLHIDYEAREHGGCDGLIAIASWQRARIGADFHGEAAVIWNWLPAAV